MITINQNKIYCFIITTMRHMLDIINQIKPIDKETINKKDFLSENVINFIIRPDIYKKYSQVNNIVTKIAKKNAPEIIENIVITTKTIIQNKQIKAEIINKILIQSLKQIYKTFEDCLSDDELNEYSFKEINNIRVELFPSKESGSN